MFISDPITGEVEGDADEGGGDAAADDAGDAGGDEPASWTEGVSDDLKPVADRFASRDDALRAIVNFQKREGQVRVPGKDADEKEIAAFHKAMGIPASVDEYTFPEIPEAEMTDAIKEERAEWAKTFHDAKVPKAAADALIGKFSEIQARALDAQIKADKANAEAETAKNREMWGADYERNEKYANTAMATIAEASGVSVDDLKQIETKDGRFLLDNALMQRMFAYVGREMGEARLGGVATEGDIESIESQVKELRDQIAVADSKGDRKEKNRLYQKEQALLAKIPRAA